MVEMGIRALSGLSISSSEEGNQMTGQNLSANSVSSMANNRRKAVATLEVDTKKLMVDNLVLGSPGVSFEVLVIRLLSSS